MLELRIVSAGELKDLKRFYTLALDFVLTYEKSCCSLMQRILQQDDSLHLIIEKTDDNSHPEVYGVFTWNERGRLVFSCLPFQNELVEKVLSDYFSSRSVFCISGESNYAAFLYRIVKKCWPGREEEAHSYYLMECTGKVLLPAAENVCVYKCSLQDAKGLMPLQVDYAAVEVLPSWRRVVPAGELLSLQQTLQHQLVLAVKYSDGKNEMLVAKANTNAVAVNYMQIGGVYTLPAFRGRGFAALLVNRISLWIEKQDKKAVLFVKEKNIPALKAYSKAGFSVTGRYRIIYFREDK